MDFETELEGWQDIHTQQVIQSAELKLTSEVWPGAADAELDVEKWWAKPWRSLQYLRDSV